MNGPKVSDSFRAMPPLPPNTPKRLKLSITLIKFLLFHSRLDGLLSFVAVWWAAWTILFNDFWKDWPVTYQITVQTWGHPMIISYTLLIAGSLGYFSKLMSWNWLRAVCFLSEFSAWGVLTLVFLTVRPVFSPGVACYSAFAIATLLAYVNFKMDLEHRAELAREDSSYVH